MKKVAFIIVLMFIVFGFVVGWTRQMRYPFPEADKTWKVKYGDTSETQIAFNIALIRYKLMELEQKVEQKATESVADPNE